MHKFLFSNEFIIFLYMFRALLCSSSGGQNCIIQHLVSSHSVGGRPQPAHRTATPPPWLDSPQWARASQMSRLHDHRHTTLGRTPLESIQTQRPLPNNTRHSQETNIHVPGGIRTRSPSKRAAADARLRPRGLWDRQKHIMAVITIKIWVCWQQDVDIFMNIIQ